ncbi:hypothetical protein M9458_051086, partial [Cirrhinus mrigala]
MHSQTSTNDSECNSTTKLIINKHKWTHVTPLFISLHWLPVVVRIKFKTLMLAYPPYFSMR